MGLSTFITPSRCINVLSPKAKLNDARLIASGRVMQTDDDVSRNENGLQAEAGAHICSGDEWNSSEFFFVYSKDRFLNY